MSNSCILSIGYIFGATNIILCGRYTNHMYMYHVNEGYNKRTMFICTCIT